LRWRKTAVRKRSARSHPLGDFWCPHYRTSGRERQNACLFSATHRFNPQAGQLFRNAREAERAAIRLTSGELKPAA